MSTYVYQDLVNDDEVRLLIVDPGREEEELVCRLVHARLSEKPDYEAVSYTWGTDAPSQHIILDGHQFPVRENILHALRRFRHATEPRTLWADAICINQNNIPERSKQVKLMKNVYTGARHVLIWLGPHLSLDSIANDVFKATEEILGGEDPGLAPDARIRDLIARESAREPQTIAALAEFFTRAWFTRMWVLQELVVGHSPQIYWAEYSTSWIALGAVAAAITSNFDAFGNTPIYTQCAHVNYMRQIREDFKDDHPQWLGFLLRVGLGLHCMDPRDKVYAILGLIPEEVARMIQVDYSAPVSEVYKAVARILYERSADLFSDLTFVSFLGSAQGENCPSWVPDYSVVTQAQRAYTHHTETHQAHGGSEPDFGFRSEDSDILTIKGYIVDTIEHRPSYTAWRADNPEQSVHSWYKKCFELCDPEQYPDGETPAEAWWRNAIADTVQLPDLRGNGRAADGYGPSYLDARLSRFITGEEPLASDETVRNEQLRYERYATGVSTEVNFCKTTRGYIGWTPLRAQAGDVVCVFAGARAPFVLRRADAEGQWKVIGDAYVHGLMSGEALQFAGFAWEDIHVR